MLSCKETHSVSGRTACLGQWSAGLRLSVTGNSFRLPQRTNRRFWVKPCHSSASHSWLLKSLLLVCVLFLGFCSIVLTCSVCLFVCFPNMLMPNSNHRNQLDILSCATGPAQSGILYDREVVNLFLHFTVNPKPRVDYIDRPRCCLRGEECSIHRFQQVESRWGYSGTSDRIRWGRRRRRQQPPWPLNRNSLWCLVSPLSRFNVNRRISIVGFGLYGSIHGPTDYQVNIQVTSFQLLSALKASANECSSVNACQLVNCHSCQKVALLHH